MFYKILGILGFGIAVFIFVYSYTERFLDWIRFQSLGTRDYVVEKLNMMFIEANPQQVLLLLFSLSFGLGSIVFLVFLPKLFPGIVFGSIVAVIGWRIPRPFVNWMYQRRVTLFVNQMVDALGLMSNGLKSGLSVVQSLGLVVQELPNPIQQEFSLILNENKLGVSLEDAFLNLSRRVPAEDVEMFVTSVNILKETGGNLAETFDTIVGTIRERTKVENKIKALTAQGIYQGMFVMAIPPILGAVFQVTDPTFMAPLFNTTIGWIIIFVIILLEIVGFFVIMKVVDIDV